MHPNHEPALNRRSFLKLGVVGSSVLASAGIIGSLQGCSSHTVENDAQAGTRTLTFLRKKDAIILSAVAPAVLKGNFPTDPTKRQQVLDQMMIDIDDFIVHTTAGTQKQVHELFDLLYMAPFRVMVAGLWPSWQEASVEEVSEFLEGWQTSRFNMLRQGYVLLTQLPSLTFYDQPANWTDDVYPGPPQHIPS